MIHLLQKPMPLEWPAYNPLMLSIRHGIYIAPLERDLETAMLEQLTEEQSTELGASIVEHVEKLETLE